MERLEYDPQSGMPGISARNVDVAEKVISIEAAPFGIYSITAVLDRDDFPVEETRLETRYGDKVWQALSKGSPDCTMRIAANPKPGRGAPSRATLRFGIAGIPFQRPRRIMERHIPLEVIFNGTSKGIVKADGFNAISLAPAEILPENIVQFKRIEDPNAMKPWKDPAEIYILSAEIETITP
jgi:hypothetical protein